MRRRLILALLLATPAAAQQAPSAPVPAEVEPMRATVAALSDDAMRGREAGTPDFDRAADYVAKALAAAGAKPGANGSWFQRVPLATTINEDAGRFAIDGVPLPESEFIPGGSFKKAEVSADAPVVFVGRGIVAPQFGIDDYAGLDVRGKIVAALTGAPESLPGEIRAHYNGNRSVEAAKRGAVGIITIPAPSQLERVPFAVIAQSVKEKAYSWAEPDGTGFSRSAIPSLGGVGPAGAAKLFAGSGISWEGIAAAEKAGQPIKGAALKTRVSAGFRSRFGKAESKNVVGLIPGTDPKVANEYVLLTAHLDHVGIGEAVNGDTIYNGAMDNAVGVATLIEVAKQLAARPARRPVLLVALTAEEKGLVGSDYFARNPVVPKDQLAANVNIDMPILTYDFVDMFAFGADRSSLGPLVEGAITPLGIKLTPDPDPAEGLFTRSDQYRFVQAGVPALFMKTGFGAGGAEATKAFRSTHYHKPSDTIALINWTAAAKWVKANAAIARAVADAPQRPVWNKGDFFGTLYGGPMAR